MQHVKKAQSGAGIRREVEEARLLPRLHWAPSACKQITDGFLPAGQDQDPPRRRFSESSAIAHAFLPPTVREHVDDLGSLARFALPDFIKGKQRIAVRGRDGFKCVARRAPRPYK